MSKTLYNIAFNFQALCMVLSFILSLRLIRNSEIPYYMRGFYWYTLVGVIVLIPNFYDLNISKIFYPVTVIMINASILFHYLFLSLFIIKLIKNKSNSNLLRIIFWTILLILMFTLNKENLTKNNNLGYSVSNFGLIIFCILYYYKLFISLPSINLKKEPSFWIVTGVFFTMSVHIPIQAALGFLRYNISYSNYILLHGIIAFCYSIMHLFLIKAFLCATHQRKAI